MKRTNTDLEKSALDFGINLSDAHSRATPCKGIKNAILNFHNIFDTSKGLNYSDLEEQFSERFFNFHSISKPDSIFISYSTSCLVLSISSIIGRYGESIFIELPSFDNIRDILRRTKCKLNYVDEGSFRNECILRRIYNSVIWITNPNNPTGHIYTHNEIQDIATICESNNNTLIIDSCFRSFCDELFNIDYLRILSSFKDLRWIILEDTGKFLPTQDIKVGFSYCSDNMVKIISIVNKELLLSVAPATLLFLDECYSVFDKDTNKNTINKNRDMICNSIQDNNEIVSVHPCKNIPLLWIKGNYEKFGLDFYNYLFNRRIHILPGSAFFEEKALGLWYARIALNRDTVEISKSLDIISMALSDIAAGRSKTLIK